ncbi:MAG: hypothetical protein WD876_01460 [Candidatus Pacearchaeota archaeon]
MAKKRSKRSRTRHISSRSGGLRSNSDKTKLVVRNIITFAILGLVFFGLNQLVSGEFWMDIFQLLWLICGFVALSFVIAWFVLLWMKALKK